MEALGKARTLLFGSTAVLIGVGIVMIYSASGIYANEQMRDSAYYLKRHLIWLGIGVYLAHWAAHTDIAKLRQRVKPILISAGVLLVLVLIPHIGSVTHGARRWFKFFGFSFQPSEYFKLAIILYLADYLDRKWGDLGDIKRTLLPALAVIGAGAALILKQPDLGTAFTVVFVSFVLLFVAGLRLRVLAALISMALPVLMYYVMTKSYRRKRMLSFLNPWEDPRGISYQITQSFIALGSGGVFGVGLGRSQQKLFFLPESHTDFIFSIIGEELGFVGACAVVLLFIAFIFAGMVIVIRGRDRFSQLLGLGLVTLIALEAVINIGVSIGALPTKGLSLPFISYGGSALLANLVAVGLLMNLSRAPVSNEPDVLAGEYR